MKKRIATLFVFLLIACLMMTGCSTGENATETEPTSSPEIEVVATEEPTSSEDEMYTYEVCGTTLKLRTRVEDYIVDDEYLRYSDLASDLGWWKEDDGTTLPYRYYGDGELYVWFHIGNIKTVTKIMFGVLESFKPMRDVFTCNVHFKIDNPSEIKTYELDVPPKASGYYLNFEQIVIVTYIFENYPDCRDNSFFDGYLEKREGNNYSVHQ
jgi:hypothetical protein